MKLTKVADDLTVHGASLLDRVGKIKDERVRRRFANRISFNADNAVKAVRATAALEDSLAQYEKEHADGKGKK